MDPGKPIVHKSQFQSSDNAIEYFLPQPEIANEVRTNLSPWMLDIVTSTKAEVTRTVDGRFAHVDHPELQILCEQLRSYTPASVVIREDMKSWLRLDSVHDVKVIGSSACIPPPPDKQRIQAQLDSTGFCSNVVFSSFARNFCGLSEDFRCSGNFLEDSEDWSVLSEEWQATIIDNYNDWFGSLLFYHARNSDQLLLHPNGYVGWWKYGEGTVTREQDSFSDFIRFYVKHREEAAWPFDSYGIPDYARKMER